jgi:peptidoglycan biosynthesis protein MviN/MurJ (putative lipid II flippase)
MLSMSPLAFLAARLSGRNRFAAPAAAPIVLNILIVGALRPAGRSASAAHAAASGGVASGVAQAAFLAVAACRADPQLPGPLPGLSEDTWLCIRSLGPAILTSGALQILFARGAFDLAATEASAAILAAYAKELVPAPALRSLVAGFRGRGDARTPLRLPLAATFLNIAFKITSAPSLGVPSLAAPASTGITLRALLLFLSARAWLCLRGPMRRQARS